MALEFICANGIEKGKKINIPSEARVYRIKSNWVKFFKVNPSIPDGENIIPELAKEMSFENYRKHPSYIDYGKPYFYDIKGNVLKE